ncbi:putative membrane protein YjcC [Pelotomaculum schinkii]|uniref:Putative membrane protein YjcC n=1 Tax=Pelotomaculum schinkii TaxID=78350 RepID=A0A4Y7R710_9FIRM|nr:EAL domain-containing protein [Pelotomaculum schinkii]TEB04738.1 putative membrane protein YjcC [Pelotomaculum schinkii]
MDFTEEINRIIEKKEILTFFQPIIHLRTGNVAGFEALSRGPVGSLHSPNNLFTTAYRCHRQQEVELVCLELAVKHSKRLPPGQVFFNLSPSTILSSSNTVLNIIDPLNDRAVIELTEIKVKNRDVGTLVAILSSFRACGIKIALDDVGKGERDFWSISEFPSDFLKINQNSIHRLARYKNGTAHRYRLMIEKLLELGKLLGAQVIAEGVETNGHCQIVKDLGIELAQGFFFSKAMPVEHWIEEEGQK